jgi:hypothetical protein
LGEHREVITDEKQGADSGTTSSDSSAKKVQVNSCWRCGAILSGAYGYSADICGACYRAENSDD